MKKTIFMLSILILSGCATMNYEAPDGTKINYSRIFTTSDNIKGALGNASIESSGQKIDAATLTAILNLLGTVK